MKKLSVEEKAEAYDKAIERARKEYKNHEAFKGFCEMLVHIFPALKESEDERIVRCLLDYFNHVRYNGLDLKDTDVDEVIAWLEKQGEHKRFRDCIQIGDKVTRNEAGELVNISQLLRIAKPRIVKPADKVELKFKIGDWVVFNNKHQSIYQIEKIEDGYYILRHTHGGTFRVCVLHDESLRLWTIQDAKDGDVLAYNDGSLAIFRYRLSGLDAGLYMSHILLTNKIEFKQTCAINNAKPATKEQRDTLLKAMTDAGYTFDFNKKELRKTEQKSAEWSYDEGKQIQINPSDYINDMGGNGCYLKNTAQASAWSEEDEHWRQKAIDFMEHPDLIKATPTLSKDTIDWLKSLKDRVQPKQEWSKEDEDAIGMAIIALDDMYNPDAPSNTYAEYSMPFNKAVERLKSLRHQKQWKPSEEQLEALESATENCAYSEYQDCLRELIGQLKRLKG